MIYSGSAISVAAVGDGIAELKLDLSGEKVNKLNQATLQEFDAATQAIAKDGSVKGVIVTSGKAVFIVGADITEFAARTAEEQRAVYAQRRIYETVADFPKPVIAAIHGFCIGGGSELALACDIRVADRTARISQAEIRIGLIPGGGGTQRLARLVRDVAERPDLRVLRDADVRRAGQHERRGREVTGVDVQASQDGQRGAHLLVVATELRLEDGE